MFLYMLVAFRPRVRLTLVAFLESTKLNVTEDMEKDHRLDQKGERDTHFLLACSRCYFKVIRQEGT